MGKESKRSRAMQWTPERTNEEVTTNSSTMWCVWYTHTNATKRYVYEENDDTTGREVHV